MSAQLSIDVTKATFVDQMPSLSHAALSHMSDRARNPPASEAVVLLFPALLVHNPARKIVGIHTSAHETEATSSWWWTGPWTPATAARTAKSSGTRRWWCLRAFSTIRETTGCIGAKCYRSSAGIESVDGEMWWSSRAARDLEDEVSQGQEHRDRDPLAWRANDAIEQIT